MPTSLTRLRNDRIYVDLDTKKDLEETIKSISSRGKDRVVLPSENLVHTNSPAYAIVRLESPPLFPRDRNPGHVINGQGISRSVGKAGDILDLITSAPLEIRSSQGSDMYKQHMAVVSGWTALVTPFSPTPSLESGTSEIDELLSPSPPDASPLYVKLLEDSKMDEYEMPRAEGKMLGSQAFGAGQSLSDFLSPVLHPIPVARNVDPRIITSPKLQSSSPQTIITASMLGQPPSADDEDIRNSLSARSSRLEDPKSDDTDDLLTNIQARGGLLPSQDPLGFVLKETFDDKEALMMQIPQLPPPNEHNPSTIIPAGMAHLLASWKCGQQDQVEALGASVSCLKKVKGLQSLNIELSWRPFNFGYHVPTDEEVADVDEKTSGRLRTWLESNSPGAGEVLSGLLGSLPDFGDDDVGEHVFTPAERHFTLNDGPISAEFYTLDDDAFALTEQERRRLHGHPQKYHDPDEYTSSSGKHDDSPESQSPPQKKHKRGTPDWQTVSYAQPPSEDSGIYINDIVETGRPGHSQFCQISDEAEGFPGPSQDGELFPDIDPVHYLTGSSPTYDATYSRDSVRLARSPSISAHGIGFMPLSFDSTQQQYPGPVHEQHSYERLSEAELNPAPPKSREATPHDSGLGEVEGDLRQLDSTPPLPKKALLVSHRRQSLAMFLAIRAKELTFTNEVLPSSPPATVPNNNLALNEDCQTYFPIPEEISDRNTLELPASLPDVKHRHQYMAALAIAEKRSLVRLLSLPHNSVNLVVREDLGGAHLILDPSTAVYTTPLLALSSQTDELLETISRLSWRFLNILIIFEAFSPSSYLQENPRPSAVNPFSPPTLKAIRKFRRDLSLAEAYSNKCPGTTVHYAFALDADHVSRYIRMFGDLAESGDSTNGAIWGDRIWLEGDEEDGERDLAFVNGMNTFIASIILSQTTLEDFLQQSPDERLQNFGYLVGRERLVMVLKSSKYLG
ncbi:hypothetical protein BXZ70DRAFT_896480 [Cristinia sonorae]|uniref:Uncharacterized protein n=1 Tax=Cristinia sonorae TaxID=1940300 RepID=A0A8K0UKJ1_9AGAR|nr:hypothetical protein BXZ70DRAFT_896480 [Cristinia sonorae]